MNFRFRQIKLQTFQKAWIIPHKSFSTEKKLTNYLEHLSQPVAHVYATVLQFLDASQLTTKETPAICLSGPFMMDFDVQGHLLYSQEELDLLKEQVVDTADLLHDWYDLSQFVYVFSGHKGFHLYALDFPRKCLKQSIWGYEQEKYEKQQRHRVAWQLTQAGLTFDYPISTDTRRIIRIPGTIHGKTGLRCYSFSSEKELWNFKLEDAQAVESKEIRGNIIQVEVKRSLPPFIWEDQEYSGRSGDQLKVPLPLAVLLMLQHDVQVPQDSCFAELLESSNDDPILSCWQL